MIEYGTVTHRTLGDSIAQGDIDALREILAQNPSLIHLKQNLWMDTPLHTAARYGQAQAFEFLLSCPGVEVNARNAWGETALLLCARYSRLAMAETLLATSSGVDINATDIAGNNALHLSASQKGSSPKEDFDMDWAVANMHAEGRISDDELYVALSNMQTKRDLYKRYEAMLMERSRTEEAPQVDLNEYISPKSRTTALLLCIFLGTWGAHRFYAGRPKGGILFIALYLASLIGSARLPILGGLFAVGLLGWWLADLVTIIRKDFKDSDGRWIV